VTTQPRFEHDHGPAGDTLRVVVVAAYPAVRAGLRALLESGGGIELVAEGTPGTLAAGEQPVADMVVVDAGDDETTVPALQNLFPGMPLVMVGPHPDDIANDVRAFAAARAYLTREATGEELAAAVRAVAQGLVVFSPALLASMRAESPTGARRDQGPDSLTERELEVLPLLAAGLPNKAIALRMGISEHTVKFHVGAILSKLGASSRTEAVVLAARRGILPL